MTKPTETLVEFPRQSARDVLTEVLRTGARQLLATAIEAEVDEYVAVRAKTVDAAGRRGVVPQRPPAQTGAANPARGRHRAAGRGFGTAGRTTNGRRSGRRSCRRTCGRHPAWRRLYPWLYLKGLSTGDFGEALQALLGVDAQGSVCDHDYAA